MASTTDKSEFTCEHCGLALPTAVALEAHKNACGPEADELAQAQKELYIQQRKAELEAEKASAKVKKAAEKKAAAARELSNAREKAGVLKLLEGDSLVYVECVPPMIPAAVDRAESEIPGLKFLTSMVVVPGRVGVVLEKTKRATKK